MRKGCVELEMLVDTVEQQQQLCILTTVDSECRVRPVVRFSRTFKWRVEGSVVVRTEGFRVRRGAFFFAEQHVRESA